MKEKVHLAGIGQQEKPKQLKNADVSVHDSKLWCGTCNMWFPGEIVMAAHFNGREHLAKFQLPMSSMSVAERYLEENGSDAQEKTYYNQGISDVTSARSSQVLSKLFFPALIISVPIMISCLQSKAEGIQATDTCDKAGMLTPSQLSFLLKPLDEKLKPVTLAVVPDSLK